MENIALDFPQYQIKIRYSRYKMGSIYSHMIGNLLLVLTLMLGLLYLIKKFKLKKFSANPAINIINMLPIGAKEKLLLIEVQGKTILLGATPNHIEALHIFEDKKMDVNENKNLTSFSDHLANVNRNL